MPKQIFRYGVISVCAMALFGIAQHNATTAAPDGYNGDLQNSADVFARQRLREGTLITDAIGYFRQDGDGATFVTDDGQELGGLSNLNLERVVRTLKGTDETKRLRWSVSGTVTEFMNRNFLLISRAVYKSAAQPPVPDQISN